MNPFIEAHCSALQLPDSAETSLFTWCCFSLLYHVSLASYFCIEFDERASNFVSAQKEAASIVLLEEYPPMCSIVFSGGDAKKRHFRPHPH